MPLFVSTTSTATRPGVYAYSRTPPAIIKALNTGVACIVGQFPWGPAVAAQASQGLYSPSSDSDRLLTFAPPGMSRLGTGYLAMIQKGWPTLKVIRVANATDAAATCPINKTGPTLLFTIGAKFVGTAGNSITGTISAATDGDANHFNVTVTVTGASGTTSDIFQNLNLSGTGADVIPTAAQLASARLVGSFTKSSAGLPIIGSTTFSGGTSGAIVSSDYVGTQGATDKGFALMEGDLTISHKFTDDPGNTIRAAVNAGALAHGNYMSNSLVYISGNSGLSASAAQTDAATYRSNYVVYADPWVKEYDDTSGALQLVQLAPFLASVGAQTSPSTRLAARDSSITQFLSGIQAVETNRGQNAAQNTLSGITTCIPNPNGGFMLELDVVTNAPVNPAQADVPTWRIGIYVASALQNSLQSFINGPNVQVTQQSILNAADDFLSTLKRNKDRDPLHNPYILGYQFDSITQYNTPADQAAGNFTVPISIQTDAGMQKIFLAMQFAPTVALTVKQTP